MAIPTPQELLKRIQGGSSTSPFFDSEPVGPAIPSPQDVLKKSRENQEQPSFGATLLKTGGDFMRKVGQKVNEFYTGQAKNVQDFAQGELKLTPSDVLEGTKQTFAGLGKGALATAKGFNEGVARIVGSAAEGVLGKENTRKISEFGGPISIAAFSRDITGREEIGSYQDIFGKARNYALENNASIDQADVFGGLAVFGLIAADNPLFGPGKSGVIKLSDNALAEIAAANTDDVVDEILRREVPGLTDRERSVLVPAFREAPDPETVRAIAEQADRAAQVPLRTADDADSPEGVLARSRQPFETPAARQAQEATPFADDLFRAVPDEATGATRFDRVADTQKVDVVEGIDTYVVKGPNDTYEVIEASTGRMIGRVADTAQAAIQSAKEALTGKTPEEIKARLDAIPDKPPRGTPGGSPRAGTFGESKVDAPFSRELIRAISAEKMPGPILDLLRKEFPSLSDRALTPIAKRLSKLSRTADLEGILSVVRNIDRDIQAARSGKEVKFGAKSFAKVATGRHEAVGDLPPAVGELLTADERSTYLDLLTRDIKNSQDAALAQQEYDALWEYADQRILDRYEELRTERDILRDAIGNHPGKELMGLYKGTFKSPDDVELDELINQSKGKNIDTKIDEILGNVGGDISVAQETLNTWRQMRATLAEVEADMRELRPKVKAARALQSMIEDVPVITRERAGDIRTLALPQNIEKYKDISGFSGQTRDLHRNFEEFFGESYPEAKRIILDPLDEAKGKYVDEVNTLFEDLEKKVVKELGINRGTPEAAAIMRFGDTSIQEGKRLTMEGLVREFGSEKAEKIQIAERYFRRTYDRLIDEANEVLAEIYPNNPSKLIPKRKDYFRHFQEFSDGVRGLVDLLEIRSDSVFPHEINPRLSGTSEFTKPNMKWLSFAQQRTGKGTDLDAISGFMNYVPDFAYLKHISPMIGQFRYLRRELADVAPEAKPLKEGEKRRNNEDLIGNFLSYLDDYANDLAGKTNPADRWLQKVVPGGRKTFKTIEWINNRVKANTILGSLSSSIAQIFNVPQGIASAKKYSLPGINRTLAGIFNENQPMKDSIFIRERYQDDPRSRFKLDWAEHPVLGSTERAKEVAVWMTGVLDEIGTKFIWNSHFEKAVAEGVPDPVKYADEITRKLVGGRGIGEKPLIQKSKIFQLVAPFTLEVANAWRIQGDFLKKRDFAALAIFFAASYLMNKAAEEVRGSKVVFDPIESLLDGGVQFADEMEESGDPARAAYKFTGRQVGEILSNLPVGQTVAAGISDDWIKKLGFEGGKKELFGAADPTRFGTGLLALNGISDPLYKLIPGFGGAQIKRTVEGVEAMLAGEVRDKNDNLSFEVEATPLNVIQAVLFGKNATQEAQKFYDERDDLFRRVYRQDASRREDRLEAEKIWKEVRSLPKDQAIAKLQELETKDPLLAEAVGEVAEEQALGLTGTERMIKMLGVENGERAKFIADRVKNLKTKEDKAKYLQNLDDKKLISDDVFDQLTVLLEGEFAQGE